MLDGVLRYDVLQMVLDSEAREQGLVAYRVTVEKIPQCESGKARLRISGMIDTV